MRLTLSYRTRLFLIPIFICICNFQSVFGQFTSSTLPILVITASVYPIPDDPKLTCDMGIIYNGPGATNYLNVALLGMPSENDWVLHAPYTDKSLLRNVLTYQLWNEMGHYGPRTRFCELVINGSYRGIYVLTEKIKQDTKRVNISSLGSGDIAGNNLTGGYIIKIDKTTGGGDGWTSPYLSPAPANQPVSILYHEPDAGDILTVQKTYIQTFMNNMETNLKSATFADPTTGYAKDLSITSWIDYFIINEVSRNVDGYRISSYFNKDRDSKGGKLKAGPAWDYNIAWWNADYCNAASSTGFVYTDFNSQCPGDGYQTPFWWSRLMQDPDFVNKTKCRYMELRQNVLAIPKLNTYIDKYVNDTLAVPQARHFAKWTILGTYVWPNPNTPATYAGEITNLKSWINTRLTWMDANLPGTCATLPVNLISFSGNRTENDKVILQWNTGHETNMNKFVVEKSYDGKTFKTAGEVSARNTSKQTYSFEDNERSAVLYRLKMLGNNNTLDYSEIIDVDGKNERFSDIEVYPNPFTESIDFGYHVLQPTELTIELIDATGKTLQSYSTAHDETGNFGQHISNLSGYPAGSYLLKIRSSETILYKKLIKL